ncbi:MAG: histidine--tRNA ligase [Ureaplasma sp.]|nr:histidine--tRNA ligase [Ureaplasma sp.]
MFQKPRGTCDWFGENINDYNYVCDCLKSVAKLYNFKQINTPTFEQLELFIKNIGESTDVIKKEIYDFTDKSGRRLALRPEGTAGVIRAYVENKMYGNQNYVEKLFYIMNVFRYDRPQSGRYREFNQFGIEYLKTSSYLDTVECISFAYQILNKLNIKSFKLKINNLGSFESRKKWVEVLKEYFRKYKSELTQDSIERIEINPLRILDDKVDSKKDFVINAPKLEKYLSDKEKQEFKLILKSLKDLGISYEVDNSLVRGLDYYTKTVFEFVSTLEVLGKSTIIGGGNYSNLIKETGGPDYEGLGFGLGIERIIIALKQENELKKEINKDSYLVAVENEKDNFLGMEICLKLRQKGFETFILNEENKKAKLAKYAINNNIANIIWINDNTEKNHKIILEKMQDSSKKEININELLKD